MIYGMSPQIKRLQNKPRQVITGRVMEMLIDVDGFSFIVLPNRGFSGLGFTSSMSFIFSCRGHPSPRFMRLVLTAREESCLYNVPKWLQVLAQSTAHLESIFTLNLHIFQCCNRSCGGKIFIEKYSQTHKFMFVSIENMQL